MLARYYNPVVGRFISQDPLHVSLASGQQFSNELRGSMFDSEEQRNQEKRDREVQKKYLSNPQVLNSYSYSINNPLAYRDANGKFLVEAVLLALTIYGIAQVGVDTFEYQNVYKVDPFITEQQRKDKRTEIVLNVAVNIGSRGMIPALDLVISGGSAALDFAQQNFPGVVGALINVNREKYINNIQDAQSTQTRYDAVQNYNEKLSSFESKLWVTPSGTVVTWYGITIAGPVE